MSSPPLRRVLMVSWLFPPHASIGAKRAWRFARWLPREGWAPTVLCRRAPPPSSHDASPWPVPEGVTVRAEYDSALFSVLAGSGARVIDAGVAKPAAPEGLARGWRERAKERWDALVDAVVPTETALIHAPHAMGVIARLAPSHELLWTTSYPYHSHLLGVRAAERTGRPLVVDLRDPWTPNWVHRRKWAHARRAEAWMERRVFEAARRVVVTTEALAEMYREMFPRWAEKFVVVHNSFDPLDDAALPVDARGPAEPRRLVHFGNVYGPWSFATVYRALAALRREGRLPREGVVLENYGKLGDRDRALATALGVDDCVRVMPSLPFARGMARMRGADALLLAAWDDPDARLYVQGKAFDYLAAARPVVAESAHEDIRRIVAGTGSGVVVAPGDVAAMARALERALAGEAEGWAPAPEAVAYYASPQATRRLAAIFDEVVTT